MSMGPKMFVSYVFLASLRSKSNAGIMQGRPLEQFTRTVYQQLIEDTIVGRTHALLTKISRRPSVSCSTLLLHSSILCLLVTSKARILKPIKPRSFIVSKLRVVAITWQPTYYDSDY